jgi:hypothetical protein
LIHQYGDRPRAQDALGFTSGNIASIVLSSVSSQSAPSTADIQQPVRRLEVELFTDESELVVLQLFKSLEFGRVRDDPRGVNPIEVEERVANLVWSGPASSLPSEPSPLTCVDPRTTRRNRHLGHNDP